MELAKIEELIEKYFEAQTSVAEEKMLQAYFSSPDVAPHLEQYAPMFQYYNQAKEETYTQTVPLKTRKFDYKRISVAAVFILGLGVFGQQVIEYQEEQKAREAYYKTKEMLNLVSSKFNKGAEKITYLNEFEKAKNQVFKTEN